MIKNVLQCSHTSIYPFGIVAIGPDLKSTSRDNSVFFFVVQANEPCPTCASLALLLQDMFSHEDFIGEWRRKNSSFFRYAMGRHSLVHVGFSIHQRNNNDIHRRVTVINSSPRPNNHKRVPVHQLGYTTSGKFTL